MNPIRYYYEVMSITSPDYKSDDGAYHLPFNHDEDEDDNEDLVVDASDDDADG
jgi:hypothetical protein